MSNKFNTINSFDGKSLHQIHLAMKSGVPNITLHHLDRFQFDRMRILRQSYVHFQIQEWLFGTFSFELRFSKKIPSIVWHYSKLVVFCEEKWALFSMLKSQLLTKMVNIKG